MSDTNKTESLHDQIMRLPRDPAEYTNVNMMLAYKDGHRDARHAAAELAAAYEADAQQAAPVAKSCTGSPPAESEQARKPWP